jgi:hypothetical protein
MEMKTNKLFFDSNFSEGEQLPRRFTVCFESIRVNTKAKTKISVNGVQMGDVIDDNSYEDDGYRFHDVFHYTFAALLGWSPCTRAMMKRKRKSVPLIDEVEDGARATITEESISLMIFNRAKKTSFFLDAGRVSSALLKQIKEMTSTFEVSARSKKEWENVIVKAYELFRELVKHNGGVIHYDMMQQTATFHQR